MTQQKDRYYIEFLSDSKTLTFLELSTLSNLTMSCTRFGHIFFKDYTLDNNQRSTSKGKYSFQVRKKYFYSYKPTTSFQLLTSYFLTRFLSVDRISSRSGPSFASFHIRWDGKYHRHVYSGSLLGKYFTITILHIILFPKMSSHFSSFIQASA